MIYQYNFEEDEEASKSIFGPNYASCSGGDCDHNRINKGWECNSVGSNPGGVYNLPINQPICIYSADTKAYWGKATSDHKRQGYDLSANHRRCSNNEVFYIEKQGDTYYIKIWNGSTYTYISRSSNGKLMIKNPATQFYFVPHKDTGILIVNSIKQQDLKSVASCDMSKYTIPEAVMVQSKNYSGGLIATKNFKDGCADKFANFKDKKHNFRWETFRFRRVPNPNTFTKWDPEFLKNKTVMIRPNGGYRKNKNGWVLGVNSDKRVGMVQTSNKNHKFKLEPVGNVAYKFYIKSISDNKYVRVDGRILRANGTKGNATTFKIEPHENGYAIMTDHSNAGEVNGKFYRNTNKDWALFDREEAHVDEKWFLHFEGGL